MRVIVSVTNDLVSDQRLHKVCTTLLSNNFKVLLVGRKLPDSRPIKRQYQTCRMKLFFKKSLFFYAEYNLRLFFKLLFTKADLLIANDLDTLLANFLVAKLKRKKLIYDSHELFTEVPELIDRKKVQTIWLKIEKMILPRLKHAYTVCRSIADYYHKKYGLNMSVIRNVPMQQKHEKTEQLPENLQKFLNGQKFLLYQGAINVGRGIESLINAMQYIHSEKLIIAGNGDIFERMQTMTQELKLQNKIYFTGKIPFSELKKITPHAVLGFSVEENRGLNYYYALPNKLFDYIQAGVPVMVSPFPEMKQIVEQFNIGTFLHDRTPQKMAAQIQQVLKKKQYTQWKINLKKASQNLTWENEQQKLIDLISTLC